MILAVPLAIRDDVKQQSLITFVNSQDLITVLVRIASLADRSSCKKGKIFRPFKVFNSLPHNNPLALNGLKAG